MKKTCAALVVLLALLLSAPLATAQKFVPAPVDISKSIVNIEGKKYYEHTVVAKQTLYSICKAYGADLDEVSYINLDKIEDGLKIGTVLLIPYGNDSDGDSSKSVSIMEESEKKDDTRIEKQAENPVRDTTATTSAAKEEDSGRYIYHRVKWYDSLMLLSLKYSIPQETIMAVNNLDSRTLAVGSVLMIPVGKESEMRGEDNNMVEVGDEGLFDDDSDASGTVTIVDNSGSQTVESETIEVVPFSGTAHVALVLPIAASSATPSDNFLDFYCGVLMALNRIKAEGINVNLKVVDMADYDSFEEMATKANLDDFDFIIGHFPAEAIEEPAAFCDENRIPLISPMDQKLEAAAYNHPYMVNVPLSAATQAKRLAEAIDYSEYDDNVIVLCENGENEGQFHKDVVACLESLGIPYQVAHSGIGRTGSGNVANLLSAVKTNHIIITSEKESLAADAIRNTGLLGRGGKHSIIGYASQKTRRYDSIDQESFQNMNAHFFLGYYVDYTDESVRDFVRQYRALYNAEPSPYAFQGYDIALFFVDALSRYGSGMINGISESTASGLQLNFNFDRRSGGSGMFNEATRDIVYDEEGVTLLK